MKKTILPLLAAMVLASLADAARAQGYGDRAVVTISLLSDTAVDDTVVYLDQIARLSGGPVALRQRLARLDIAEFKLAAQQIAVPRDQVKFRLLLAGINPSQFLIVGAKQTLVAESDEPVSARKILFAAEQMMRSKHPHAGSAKDVIAPVLELRSSDRIQLDARPARGDGSRVDVVILVNGKMREIVPVAFEMPPTIPAVPIKGPSLFTQTVARTETKEKDQPLIKARDLVRLVTTIGTAQIVANGEAQQDGRLGEVIRVRNVDSNRIVSGKVESREVVTVD